MKKFLLNSFMYLICNLGISQTNIVDINDGFVSFDSPPGTYIKDEENQFEKFVGLWKWSVGSQILTFKLEKITQKYFPQYQTYQDYMIGNYSYSIDGGVTYVVNSILVNFNNDDPDINSLYSSGPIDDVSIDFTFKDIIYQKSNCRAKFTFIGINLNQLELKLSNLGGGVIAPATLPNVNFSIPNNVILIKQ